jgi:hypothetical protein
VATPPHPPAHRTRMPPEPPPPPPPPHAPAPTARGWALLLCVWAIGLAIWVLYFAAIGFVLVRVFFGRQDGAGE